MALSIQRKQNDFYSHWLINMRRGSATQNRFTILSESNEIDTQVSSDLTFFSPVATLVNNLSYTIAKHLTRATEAVWTGLKWEPILEDYYSFEEKHPIIAHFLFFREEDISTSGSKKVKTLSSVICISLEERVYDFIQAQTLPKNASFNEIIPCLEKLDRILVTLERITLRINIKFTKPLTHSFSLLTQDVLMLSEDAKHALENEPKLHQLVNEIEEIFDEELFTPTSQEISQNREKIYEERSAAYKAFSEKEEEIQREEELQRAQAEQQRALQSYNKQKEIERRGFFGKIIGQISLFSSQTASTLLNGCGYIAKKTAALARKAAFYAPFEMKLTLLGGLELSLATTANELKEVHKQIPLLREKGKREIVMQTTQTVASQIIQFAYQIPLNALTLHYVVYPSTISLKTLACSYVEDNLPSFLEVMQYCEAESSTVFSVENIIYLMYVVSFIQAYLQNLSRWNETHARIQSAHSLLGKILDTALPSPNQIVGGILDSLPIKIIKVASILGYDGCESINRINQRSHEALERFLESNSHSTALMSTINSQESETNFYCIQERLIKLGQYIEKPFFDKDKALQELNDLAQLILQIESSKDKAFAVEHFQNIQKQTSENYERFESARKKEKWEAKDRFSSDDDF